jgi:Chromo (CHRromatin Organisation MOdifier) domain
VYLKLQPYRKVSIQDNSKHHKLKPKYYGPYEILERIRDVQIEFAQWVLTASHFLCVTTEEMQREDTENYCLIASIQHRGKLRMEPTTILDRRIIKRKNQTVVEVLVRWSNLDDEEAIWEEYESLCA